MLTVGTTGQFTVSSSGSLVTSGQISVTGSNGTIQDTSVTAGSNLSLIGGASTSSILNLNTTSHAQPNTTDQIRLNVNGTIAMFLLDANGSVNIGIGTLAPSGTLDVEGTVNPIVLDGLKNSSSNVGIGTFNPGVMLDVSGSIRSVAGAVAATGACWCTNPVKVLGNCTGSLGTCTACNYNGAVC
jgi:hypothetical protein